MKGAVNSVLALVSRGARKEAVISAIDDILAPFGGTGAYSRDDHLSDEFLRSELDQLKTMGRLLPPIFLAVAAFLLNIVMTRMVEQERQQIGLLKAFGYRPVDVTLHYTKFALVVAILGIAAGWGLGAWLGRVSRSFMLNIISFHYCCLKLGQRITRSQRWSRLRRRFWGADRSATRDAFASCGGHGPACANPIWRKTFRAGRATQVVRPVKPPYPASSVALAHAGWPFVSWDSARHGSLCGHSVHSGQRQVHDGCVLSCGRTSGHERLLRRAAGAHNPTRGCSSTRC